MSEMIERIKTTIANNLGYRDFKNVAPENAEWMDELAREILSAMREPTPEIESAMRRAFERQQNIWSAAIDAALHDGAA